MNESCCYFHPKEAVVGVCALCLNERLTVLASKQQKANKFYHTKRKNNNNNNNPQKYYSFLTQRKPHQPSRIHLPKIFALSSLLGRLDIGHARRSEGDFQEDGGASISSQEDSFISIKFENNGAASWEKGGTVPMVSLDHCDMSWRRSSNHTNNAIKTSALVEHAKPRGAPLRWRQRIGHVFQVIKLRRSTKSSNVCHVGAKLEGGVKAGRRGQSWIKTLTKRKTKE